MKWCDFILTTVDGHEVLRSDNARKIIEAAQGLEDCTVSHGDGWPCEIKGNRIIKHVGDIPIRYGEHGFSVPAADVYRLPIVVLNYAKDALPGLMAACLDRLSQLQQPIDDGKFMVEADHDDADTWGYTPGYCEVSYYDYPAHVCFSGVTASDHEYEIVCNRGKSIDVKGDFTGEIFWRSLLLGLETHAPWEVDIKIKTTAEQENLIRKAKNLMANLEGFEDRIV